MTTSSSFIRVARALAWAAVALARTCFTVRLHLCIEPLARVAPDTLERSQFHTQGVGGFIVRETQEILHLDHVTPVRLHSFQLIQQLVDTQRRLYFAAIGG